MTRAVPAAATDETRRGEGRRASLPGVQMRMRGLVFTLFARTAARRSISPREENHGAPRRTQEKPPPAPGVGWLVNSSSSRRHTDGGCGGAARRNAPDARLAGASGQREYGGSCTPQLAASCIGSTVPRHAFASSALPSGEGAAATLTTTEPRGGGGCGSGCGECRGRKPQVNLGPQILKRRG